MSVINEFDNHHEGRETRETNKQRIQHSEMTMTHKSQVFKRTSEQFTPSSF